MEKSRFFKGFKMLAATWVAVMCLVSAAWGQTALSAGRSEFGVGTHTRTIDFPAQVEIYAVGAGGGGQGGHNGGDGGSGGGGAAVYMRYNETSASSNNKVTFSVSVGAGGHKGNPFNGPDQAGRQGGPGGNTSVSRGSWTLVAAGGEGGGPGARRNDGTLPVGGNDDWVKGGSGGQASSQPNIGTDIIDWATASGNPGMPGFGFRPNGKCIAHGIGNGGGNAGRINIGSYGSFGGGHGGYRNSAPCADTRINAITGGGGVSGYGATRQGHLGGNGQVIIVVTRLYSVTFNSDGGSAVNAITNIPHGETRTLSTPTRNGATFVGWFNSNGTQLFSSTPITANVALTARWTHTVTFNSNGGSSVSGAVLNSGNTVPRPNNPTRTNYFFGGWWTAQTGGNEWNFATGVTTNTTLWARWIPINYSIFYNLNGGTNHPNNPTTYNVETPTITLLSPTRNDPATANTPYTFLGWYSNANFTVGPIPSISKGDAGNKEFWAKWEFIPKPFGLDGDFDESSDKTSLFWRYSNPLNEIGKFYVYRRETSPSQGNWSLLNPSGISAINGANGSSLSYIDSINIAYGATYQYHVAFVRGTTAPSLTIPPTANGDTVSVNTQEPTFPRPINLFASFNRRTEKQGANSQVILDWVYNNYSGRSGKFYVYRREGAGDWVLLNSSGISAAKGVYNTPMAYVDNGIGFYKTYEYGIAFVESAAPNTLPSDNSSVVSIDTQLPDVSPGINAYVPFNQTSGTYVVDGVTYRDIYGTGQRNLRNNSQDVFRRLLNSVDFQFSDGGTHLSRWMDIGKLIAPLNAEVADIFADARGILNTRKTSRPTASTAATTGSLGSAASVVGAAYDMIAVFNARNGYAINGGDQLIKESDIPPDLYDTKKATSPIFWVLDRHLVHANDIDDDRSAGDADYVYYATGLIFHDLKLSYLETGDPFFSAVSGITGVIDEPFAGFRYTFGNIQGAMVSGARNLSSSVGTYTQSWTDYNAFTVGNDVSTLNGYEMSDMWGVGSSSSASHSVGVSVEVQVGAKVGGDWLGGSVETTTTVGATETVTFEEMLSKSYEFTTSEIFQHTNSHSASETISNTMEYGVEIPLPPHTQVMLRQGRSNLEVHIDYDYPVVINYKVTVVALGSRRIGGATANFIKPIATYGIDKDVANRVSRYETDAAENFNVLWAYRNDPVNRKFHSADTINLTRIWTEMKRTTGTTSNFCLWDFENGIASTPDATLVARFIAPVATGMTVEKPMTVVRGTMSQSFESMNSEIYEYQPIHALHRIEAPGLNRIDLLNGSKYYADNIELTGRNVHGVDFYGFHKDKGAWILTNADGNLHDGGIAKLTLEAGTGRPIVVADSSATGTVFLRYLINTDVYSYDGLNGYMTPQDLGMRTAIVPVNVIATGLLGIAVQPQGNTVLATDALTYPLSVEAVANANVYYQWYINTVPSNIGGLAIPGANSPTYNAPAGTIGVFYYYVVVSIDDLNVEPVVSSLATLRVERNDNTSIRDVENLGYSLFKENPVSKEMEIALDSREYSQIKFTVFDIAGNLVVSSGGKIWNLRNSAGRYVANGSYLVVVEARGRDGKVRRYSGKIGVKR